MQLQELESTAAAAPAQCPAPFCRTLYGVHQNAIIGGAVVYPYICYISSQHCLKLPKLVFSCYYTPCSRMQCMTVLCPTSEWCSYMIHQHHHCSCAPFSKLLRTAMLNPSAECCMMTSVYPSAECCMTNAMLQLLSALSRAPSCSSWLLLQRHILAASCTRGGEE